MHRINARAEKKVTEHFVAEFTRLRGKAGLLGKIAAASLTRPEGAVREVVYPAAGGEKTLRDLVAELKATNAEYARSKLPGPRRTPAWLSGSCTGHRSSSPRSSAENGQCLGKAGRLARRRCRSMWRNW
ncbi:hypothetical protein [Streptomyces noursei]|uniref:hypothetical protein n=1 Tax=Streptomyces noursei TaxID=1971 RepID=UPI0037FFCE54